MSPRLPHLLISILVGLASVAGLVWLLGGGGPLIRARAAGPLYVALTGSDTGNDCQNAASPCASLQRAVDMATPDDEIRVAGGTYIGVQSRDSLTQHVYISQTVTIQGGYTTTDNFIVSDPIANPTILDAQAGGRVIVITGTVSILENLTVMGGNVGNGGTDGPLCFGWGCGGGIYANEALTLTNVNVISNTAASHGGGVYVVGALILDGGLFQDNIASAGGGAFADNSLTLTNTQFISNTSGPLSLGGGGAWVHGPAILNGGVFQENKSDSSGGGVFAEEMALTNTVFLSNTASYGGGGAFAYQATLNGGLFQGNVATIGSGGGLNAYDIMLTSTQFLSNTAYDGGGAAMVQSGVLKNGFFLGNIATLTGGGLFSFGGGPATLIDSEFFSNTAGGGGGAYLVASVVVTGGVFQNNTAFYAGGLLSLGVVLTNTDFINNIASYSAGGVSMQDGQISGGLFQGNIAATGYGGGLVGYSGLILTGTQFIDNGALVGGGLCLSSTQNISLTNVLLARNWAIDDGAGIFVDKASDFGGVITIRHATIVGPSSIDVSAIYITSATVNITNTIIASYTTGIERAGGTVSEDYNLFFDVSTILTGGVTSGGHSLIGDPAFINPVIDDYHILGNSLALDAGFDLGVTSDFEGDSRPQGLGPDIGYDEFPFILPALFQLYVPFVTNQAIIFWGQGETE